MPDYVMSNRGQIVRRRPLTLWRALGNIWHLIYACVALSIGAVSGDEWK